MKPLEMLAALVILCLSLPYCHSVRILAIFTTPTHSHHIWNTPLVLALADRGHHITVVSPTPLKTPVPNVTDIVLEGSIDHTNEENEYESMWDLTLQQEIVLAFDWYGSSCAYSISTKGADTLFRYPKDTTFDLVIIEASGGECFLGFVQRFGSPPVIAVNGFGNPLWVNQNMGNSENPSIIPNSFLTYAHPMTFLQRIKNSLLHIGMMYYYYNNYLPSQDKLVRQYFGEGVPTIAEILNNVSLVMVNSHYSIDGPRSNVPAIIPVAGIHIKKPKPLPKDIQKFLDEAKDGVIYFSLGSLIKSSKMTAVKRQAFLDAFAELPQRVLWKWETDSLPGQSSNVRVGKWLPQNDILAHPNVKVFISHSGLLSTHEATFHGVPIVGMPFIVDQHINIEKIVNHGVGVKINYNTVTKETVLAALHKVLDDPSYRQKMQQLSALFRDQPELPLERAVYWVEHVLKHGGAPHLHSAALDLAWYQLLLIDVLAVLLAVCATCMLLLWLAGRTLCRMLRKPQKIKSN